MSTSAAPSQSHLKPSSASRPSSTSAPRTSTSSAAAKPPLNAHPTALISDSASLQGTHPITIGAGTILHPRAKLLSHEGPVNIGTGCIIGEKSVIGGTASASSASAAATPTSTATPTPTSTSPSTPTNTSTTPAITTLENNIIISPLTTICAGSHIHEAVTIDTSAFIGSHASIGAHSKVCSRCRIPDNGKVNEWIVVFGGVGEGGGGLGSSSNGFGVQGQRRRRRKLGGERRGRDGLEEGGEGAGEKGDGVSEGSIVEDGRLAVLGKEREVLGRLLGPATGGMRKR